jgi:hypothetical protein
MHLHVNPHCITIHIHKDSSHFHHVNQTLSHHFGKAFWVNETLINLPSSKQMQERKAFLTSLYYTCARESNSHNTLFLQKLIALHDKPIKVVQKKNAKQAICVEAKEDYRLLGAKPHECFEAIRKKYLLLAKQYHPDALDVSLKNKPLCTQKFQDIQEAYERIKTAKKQPHAA